MNQKTLTIKQFCEAYNLSRSTLHRLWAAGRGPDRVRINRKVLIPVEAAEIWLRSQMMGAEHD